MKMYVLEFLNFYLELFRKEHRLKGKLSVNSISNQNFSDICEKLETCSSVEELIILERELTEILRKEFLNENN